MDEMTKENVANVEEVTANTVENKSVAGNNYLFKSKKFIILTIALLLLISLITILFATSKPKITGKLPPPEPENVLLATVGDKKIYRNDARDLASLYIFPSAINDEVIKTFLEKIIEREILDLEAKKYEIKIDEQLINNEIGGLTINDRNYKRVKDDAYYKLLKNEILKKNITTLKLYRISYWIPAPTDPESKYDNYELEKKELEKAIREIYSDISNGQDPLKVTRKIYNKYKLVQERLAYNGGIVKTLSTDLTTSTPLEININKLKYSGNYFFDAIMKMKINDVLLISDPDGRGESVVILVSTGSKEFNSFEDFLEKRKKEIVRFKIIK